MPDPLTLTAQRTLAQEAPALRNDTLEQMARILSQVYHTHQKQRMRDEMEACLRAKQSPRKTQEAPCGLFEQTQGRLF